MNINKKFGNWMRSYMDTINYLSEMEEELMTKKKEAEKVAKGRLEKEIGKIDQEICSKLAEEMSKRPGISEEDNWDLVFKLKLMSAPVLHEIYIRLEEGRKAIEENKRIKASLDNVNEAIKKMFKLV